MYCGGEIEMDTQSDRFFYLLSGLIVMKIVKITRID